MSPVYKLSANSVKNGRTVYGSMLAGNSSYVAPTPAFESIATVTVGSTSQSAISFTSIPSTYTHLQIRGILRTSAGEVQPALNMQINSSYLDRNHAVYGSGSSIGVYQGSGGNISHAVGANAAASIFYNLVIDILDYANTNKHKTIRVLGGSEYGDNGFIELTSGLEQTTSAVTSIQFGSSANFVQYSQLALYGIKGTA